MPDVPVNVQTLVTTSATTAPAAGTSETWTVTALATGFAALGADETYTLIDVTTDSTAAQNAEICRVTATSGSGDTSISVTRGCDGTTPVAHSNPATFAVVVVAASIVKPSYPGYAAAPGDYRLKNEYDQLRGIYNYKSANTRNIDQGMSNSMVSNAATDTASLNGGMTEWLWIGDSGSAGANSSIGTNQFDRLRAVPLACRDVLAIMGTPIAGSGYIRFVDSQNFSDARNTATTGTWINDRASMHSTVNTSSITTRIDRPATQLDIWYYRWASGGTFSVAINGATTGVNFLSVATAGTAGWVRARMPGVSIDKGALVKCTLTTAASGVYLAGLVPFTPNGGLIVNNVSQSGSRAGGSATSGDNWVDMTDTGLGGVYKNLAVGTIATRTVTDAVFNSTTTMTSASAAFTQDDVGKPVDVSTVATGKALTGQAYIASVTNSTTVILNQTAVQTLSAQTVKIGRGASALHIELGLNDLSNGRTPAQVVADITTIRNTFPSSANGTDCVLHLVGEMSYGTITEAVQRDFWQKMYQLADTLDCPLYDWRDRMGTYTQGQAINSYGDFFAHPTSATTSDIGASLACIIGPGNGLPSHPQAPVRGEDLTNRRWIEDNYGRSARVTVGDTVTTTVEKVVARVFIPANMFKVGTLIKYSLWAGSAATATVVTTRIRIGPLGTTSDPSLIIMSASASTAGPRYMEGSDQIQVIGTSATHIGGGTSTIGTATAAGTAVAATSSFDSTKDNWVMVTLTNTTSATTTMYAGELEVKL